MMPSSPKGYLMLRSLEIKNFRGISDLSLANLSRVNVIVGPNASGKTAFLESVLLGCRGTPHTALQIWQGRSQTNVAPLGEAGFKAVWSGLFPDLDMQRQISITYVDSEMGRRALRIAPQKAQIVTEGRHNRRAAMALAAKAPATNQLPEIRALDFERVEAGGRITHLLSEIGPQGQLVAPASKDLGPALAIFSASATYAESDNITWLSDLSIENREGEVLELIEQEFPSIKSVNILSPLGFQGIYVTYSGVENKLPINVVSSGIQKVMTLILASLSYTRGVILVDEFENGLFYRRYSDVWSLIHRLAITHDNQIFVTSHSLECLQASLPVVRASPQDFTLIRMERGESGIFAKRFNGVEFAAALEQDIDPRGNEFAVNAPT